MRSEPLKTREAVALLGVVVLAWGINWPITKTIVRDLSPLWSTSTRCGIAAVALGTLLAVRGEFIIPKRGDLPVVLSTSILHMSAYSALVAAGLQYLPAGRAIVLGYSTPIWVAVGAHFFLAEEVTYRKALGVGSGLAGLAVIFSPTSLDWSNSNAVIGSGLVMLAAVCWAANIVYVRAHKWISSPFQLVFWQILLAFVVLSTLAILDSGLPRIAWTPRLIGLLCFSGIVCTALAHWAMSVVNRNLSAVTTSLGLLATPALGILSGIVVLGEPFEPSLFIAFALLVSGIAAGILEEAKPRTLSPIQLTKHTED